MWFKLAGADFSKNNLGTMSSISSSYLINYSKLTGMSGTPTSVSYAGSSAGTAKSVEVTITVTSGYSFKNGSKITASGGATGAVFTADKDYVGGNTFKFSMNITGNVELTGAAEAVSTGGGSSSGGSGEVIVPTPDNTTTGTLFLQNGALSVVKGENFFVNFNGTGRMNSSSTTEATGILVPANGTITLTGTSGLRFDYVYATSAGPNGTDKTVNTIGGIGTASDFTSANYFPLNTSGADSFSITNNYGQDYYYHFAIKGVSASSLNPEDYTITYVVTSAPIVEEPTDYPTSGTLPLVNKMISVVSDEGFFLGSAKTTRMSSGSSTDETGIYIPKGKTITLTGISGLRMDYVWADNAGPCSTTRGTEWGGIGAASNFVSSNYFPLNADGSSNTITVTNDKGNYYFFFCFAGPNKSETISVDDYSITWAIS